MLKYMYRIDLKSDAQPVKHAARRVPESIKPKVKEELDRLVEDGIIKRVECPTDWVNSIACVSKPNGNIKLCLDPKDLNKYIKRPHHYSPRIDDVLPDLCGSKFFSTLDAPSGYWNIPLDDQSQLLTTFNTQYSMCSLAVSTQDSPAVEPRSNPGSGKILMSENLRLYTTSPVVMC